MTLIHLHIPKNAGTTLGRMLKVQTLLRPPTNAMRRRVVLGCYTTPGLEARAAAVRALSERDRSRVRLYEAHGGWGMHEAAGLAPRYITILREPVSRTLSVFAFLKQIGALDEGVSLERFLEEGPHDPVWTVDNAHVRYLAGENGFFDTRPTGGVTREMLETAKERLAGPEMVWFGLTERFDESVAMLLRDLGWRRAAYITSNVGKKRGVKREVSPQTLQRVREMNALDAALYEFAKGLFEERVREGGEALQRDARALRARSERWSRVAGGALDAQADARRWLRRVRGVDGDGRKEARA